jgi:hypothetical protein
MTDEPMPPVADAPIAAAAPPAVPVRGRRQVLLLVGLLIAFLVLVLFTVKDNAAADNLKVGDCFDVPTALSVSTVTHHACTEPHTAEVFEVVQYSGPPMDTPLRPTIGAFVGTACDPVFATYVGKALADAPDLSIGYLYPSVDAWQHGNRSITCYALRTDQAALTSSLKGSRGP